MINGFGSRYTYAASFIFNFSAAWHEVENAEVCMFLQGTYNILLQRSYTMRNKVEIVCEAESLISDCRTTLLILLFVKCR